MGTPVWSHGGIVCNSSLGGNARRAIDIREGDKVDEAALKDLIRAAVALNLNVHTLFETSTSTCHRSSR